MMDIKLGTDHTLINLDYLDESDDQPLCSHYEPLFMGKPFFPGLQWKSLLSVIDHL